MNMFSLYLQPQFEILTKLDQHISAMVTMSVQVCEAQCCHQCESQTQ